MIRAAIEMMPPDDSYDSHAVGDAWIEENQSTAFVYLALPFFPDEENLNQINANEVKWWEAAEAAYRKAHQGKNMIFKDRP